MKKINLDRKRSTCFGYRHDGKNGCSILDIRPCPEQCAVCSFFKTKDQYENDRLHWEHCLEKNGMKSIMYDKEDGRYVKLVIDEKYEG